MPNELIQGSKDTHHRDATKDLPMPAKRQTDRNAPVGFNLARSNTAGLVERHPPESAPLLERDLDSSQPGDAAGETRAKQVALSRPGEEPQRFHLAAEKVRNLLKAYYIRSRPDVEAKELLYGRVASGMCFGFEHSTSYLPTSRRGTNRSPARKKKRRRRKKPKARLFYARGT